MAPPAASRHTRAFASACFSARRGSQPAHAARLALSDEAAQALADLLPILMCGEASAEWVFEAVAAALTDGANANLAAALQGIAEDEQRHGLWLSQLKAGLPPPSARGTTRRAAHFLRTLASDDLAIHLSRVAALDAGVCVVLAEVCARGTPIAANPALLNVFSRIRRDEGRHVRISRRCAAALGVSSVTELVERRAVLAGFAALLAPKAATFAAIGVDMSRLHRRFDEATSKTGVLRR